jgi:hypothetical protein
MRHSVPIQDKKDFNILSPFKDTRLKFGTFQIQNRKILFLQMNKPQNAQFIIIHQFSSTPGHDFL